MQTVLRCAPPTSALPWGAMAVNWRRKSPILSSVTTTCKRYIIAVEQGRAIYDDIKKAVHFILASNTSEIAVTLLATAIGAGEPLNPIQLLWINLVTDIFPELALSVELPEADVMSRPPRDPQAPMFSRTDLQRIGVEGALLTAATLTAYGIGLTRYGVGPRASTLAFMTITVAQLLHALSCRSERHSIFEPGACPPNRLCHWLSAVVSVCR